MFLFSARPKVGAGLFELQRSNIFNLSHVRNRVNNQNKCCPCTFLQPVCWIFTFLSSCNFMFLLVSVLLRPLVRFRHNNQLVRAERGSARDVPVSVFGRDGWKKNGLRTAYEPQSWTVATGLEEFSPVSPPPSPPPPIRINMMSICYAACDMNKCERISGLQKRKVPAFTPVDCADVAPSFPKPNLLFVAWHQLNCNRWRSPHHRSVKLRHCDADRRDSVGLSLCRSLNVSSFTLKILNSPLVSEASLPAFVCFPPCPDWFHTALFIAPSPVYSLCVPLSVSGCQVGLCTSSYCPTVCTVL